MSSSACAEPSPRRLEEQRGLNAIQVAVDNARLAKGDRPGRRMTYKRLAALSGLKEGTVRTLCTGPMKTPPPKEQMEALAKALGPGGPTDPEGLDAERLQRLAGVVFGWNVYGVRDERMDMLVAAEVELPEHELAAVWALVNALSRNRLGPMPTPGELGAGEDGSPRL